MRFILVGDGHPAASTLRRLQDAGADVRQVFATAGQENRGQLTRMCADADIPLLDSSLLTGPTAVEALDLPVDWILNVNSTVILPPSVLDAPESGALNMHPGRLPDYAGLHTHQWAIRNGESAFGVTVHEMHASVDTGAVVGRRDFPLDGSETGLALYLKCMEEGGSLLGEVIDRIMAGEALEPLPQDLSRRRLYRHREALDGRIDWSQSAAAIERFVRAAAYAPLSSPTYTPTTHLPSGQVLTVDEVVLGESAPEAPVSGTVVADEEGAGAVCGDGVLVWLERVRLDGVALTGPALLAHLGPGDRLR